MRYENLYSFINRSTIKLIKNFVVCSVANRRESRVCGARSVTTRHFGFA